MTYSLLLSLLPYSLVILALFFGYGSLVRRGTLGTVTQVLGIGAIVGVLAVGLWGYATYSTLAPALRTNLPTVLLGPSVMAFCAGVCVWTAYRTQRVAILSEYNIGDTRLILMSCSPMRLPDARALIVPTTTAGVPTLGSAGGTILAQTGSRDLGKVLKAAAPLAVGKSVQTEAGRLAAGAVFWVSLHEANKNADANAVRKGIERAMEQARQTDAESVAVVMTPPRGMSVTQTATAIGEAVLKQKRAFGQITLAVLEERENTEVQAALEALLQKMAPDALPKDKAAKPTGGFAKTL